MAYHDCTNNCAVASCVAGPETPARCNTATNRCEPDLSQVLQFGSHQQYEAGYRFQHISNGGIKEPNPGINFHQLYLQYNF